VQTQQLFLRGGRGAFGSIKGKLGAGGVPTFSGGKVIRGPTGFISEKSNPAQFKAAMAAGSAGGLAARARLGGLRSLAPLAFLGGPGIGIAVTAGLIGIPMLVNYLQNRNRSSLTDGVGGNVVTRNGIPIGGGGGGGATTSITIGELIHVDEVSGDIGLEKLTRIMSEAVENLSDTPVETTGNLIRQGN